MAARYIGRKPIKLANGRIIKTNDIINEMSDEAAKIRIGFEPVQKEQKKESKKYYKEPDNE
jgi:hypothetical protein